MGRYYRLSKNISEEEAENIINEVHKVDNVKSAQITEDKLYLLIDADEMFYSSIMGKAVNICSREVEGLELSFARFAV